MKNSRKVISFILVLLLLALPILLWQNLQSVEDWWKLRNYDPPPAISALASKDSMTEEARRVFYANHPQLINEKVVFQQACPHTEKTIVLGCYHSDQRGIDIYNVQDDRLKGVEEVTAAHEMLHAAYDRLSSEQKDEIGMLLYGYSKEIKDKRILDTINLYKKTEPDDIINEMHSIFGTEIMDLPNSLENYYKQYFKDRSKVVQLSNNYQQAFTSHENQAKQLLAQLNSIKDQISSLSSQLNDERQYFDTQRPNIQTQAQANTFNRRVEAYNQMIIRYNQLVNNFNELRDQYNELVLQEKELIKAIDTRSTTTTAQ